MDSSIITKVEKLLRLAANAGTDGESQAAFARASALMAKHGIEQHQLNVKGDTEAKPFEFGEQELDQKWATALPEHAYLIYILDTCLGVRVLTIKGRKLGRNYVGYSMVGTKDDCTLAVFAFDHLGKTFRSCWKRTVDSLRAKGTIPQWMETVPAKFRNGYYAGLTRGFCDAWVESHRREEEEAGDAGKRYAIVLQDKAAALDEHLSDVPEKKGRQKDSHGALFSHGYHDGKNINLNRPLPEASRQTA